MNAPALSMTAAALLRRSGMSAENVLKLLAESDARRAAHLAETGHAAPLLPALSARPVEDARR